jgi:hypothetical protein
MNPHFPNCCNHPEGTFVAPFEFEGRKYDIYVYPGDAIPRPHVCMRYGDERHEYISPGPLDVFLQSSYASALYRDAVRVLLNHGTIEWKRK